MSTPTTSAALAIAVASFAISACGGEGPSGIALESRGPVADVEVTQTGEQLVARWEQTADSSACELEFRLRSGTTGTESFGAIAAVPVVEQVFDVPDEVVSAVLVCT